MTEFKIQIYLSSHRELDLVILWFLRPLLFLQHLIAINFFHFILSHAYIKLESLNAMVKIYTPKLYHQ